MTTPERDPLDADNISRDAANLIARCSDDGALHDLVASLLTSARQGRLLDTRAAIGGDDPDRDIRALPAEPGVGVTPFQSSLVARTAGGWSPEPVQLSLAGEQGVHVLKGGGG